MLEGRNDRGDISGVLTLSNLLKRNELLRSVPGKELGFEQVLDPQNPQKANQRIWDWHGSEFYMDSAPGRQKIRISVPGGESTTWDNIKAEWFTKDRSGNTQKMSRSGIEFQASTQFSVNANTNITMKANINATIKANVNFYAEGMVSAHVKGLVNGTFEGGVKAHVKAPLVDLGFIGMLPVAYLGSTVMTIFGPAFVITGSSTVKTAI